MKNNILDSFGPMSTVRFILNFNLACDTNRLHERVGQWLLTFFIKNPAAAVLSSWIKLSSNSHKHRKERALTSYRKVDNYLLNTYSTHDVIVEMDEKTIWSTQSSNITLTEYTAAPWSKELRCNFVYLDLIHVHEESTSSSLTQSPQATTLPVI